VIGYEISHQFKYNPMLDSPA